jgi:hypothetical protein
VFKVSLPLFIERKVTLFRGAKRSYTCVKVYTLAIGGVKKAVHVVRKHTRDLLPVLAVLKRSRKEHAGIKV